MTTPNKPKRPTATRERKRSTKADMPTARKLDDVADLTPDRLRHLWEIHNRPDRPEVRAMMERMYRNSY
jgi:hypothetical protein